MSQFHVNQIETHVRTRYGDAHWDPKLDDAANLSRLLALHGINLVLGTSEEDDHRVVEITDGDNDRGIDAVGIDLSAKLVVFVQSKWRKDGAGSMRLADVLRFLDGVRSLLGMRGAAGVSRASDEMRKAVHDLLKTPGARIRLVTATTGGDSLAPEVQEPINELLAQLNDLEGTEPIATHIHLGQAEFFNALTEAPRPRVDLVAQIQDWGRVTEPTRAFYGRVNAAEIAQWYKQYGQDLFAQNIRVVIPRSDVNEGILNTIREEPERFGYYNNGITILAEQIEIGPAGTLNRDVGYFRLANASVVNGAQTVSTLGSVLGTEFESNLGRAFVLVRCIEVGADGTELGRRITRYANTQNNVSSQDFSFLDPQQHRLARELRALGYEYIIRSEETPKSADRTKVIDVREAAVGLACASANIAHTVTAKREVSRLFLDRSTYKALFNETTEALRLLRAVLITRAVDRVLDEIEEQSSGIVAGVAVHGRRIIARLLLRELGDRVLADPDTDMDRILANVGPVVRTALDRLVEHFPENAYPGNVFKNQARCVQLLEVAGYGAQQ